MGRLQNVTARSAVKAFERAGFAITGQKDSHIRLKNARGTKIVIPGHTEDLKRPLLKAPIKDAGLTEDEFRNFL